MDGWMWKALMNSDLYKDVVNEMNTVLGHDSALQGYFGPGTNWANEMNFVMNHPLVQDRSLDLLTSSPVCYHCATDAPLG